MEKIKFWHSFLTLKNFTNKFHMLLLRCYIWLLFKGTCTTQCTFAVLFSTLFRLLSTTGNVNFLHSGTDDQEHLDVGRSLSVSCSSSFAQKICIFCGNCNVNYFTLKWLYLSPDTVFNRFFVMTQLRISFEFNHLVMLLFVY